MFTRDSPTVVVHETDSLVMFGDPGKSTSPVALIEEARRRARWRRFWRASAVFLIILAALAGTDFIGRGGDADRPRLSKNPHPNHLATRTDSTKTTGVAAVEPCGDTQEVFVNSDDGWYVANGRIFSTTDTGKRWVLSYQGPTCVVSVDFINAKQGWALGSPDGSAAPMLRTFNGGKSWIAMHIPGGLRGGEIQFSSPSVGWGLTTTGGRLMRSINGGQTWSALASPSGTQTMCADSDGVWLGLENGTVFSKSDKSSTWTQSIPYSQVPKPGPNYPQGPPSEYLGCFGRTVWIEYEMACGLGSCDYQVERSLDGGLHWATTRMRSSAFLALGGVTSSLAAWFVSWDNNHSYVLETTTDGGASFQTSEPFCSVGCDELLPANSFRGTSRGLVIMDTGTWSAPGSHPRVAATNDGGRTWHLLSSS